MKEKPAMKPTADDLAGTPGNGDQRSLLAHLRREEVFAPFVEHFDLSRWLDASSGPVR